MTPAAPKRRPGRPPNPAGPRPIVRWEAQLSPESAALVAAWAEAKSLAGASKAAILEAMLGLAMLAEQAEPRD